MKLLPILRSNIITSLTEMQTRGEFDSALENTMDFNTLSDKDLLYYLEEWLDNSTNATLDIQTNNIIQELLTKIPCHNNIDKTALFYQIQKDILEFVNTQTQFQTNIETITNESYSEFYQDNVLLFSSKHSFEEWFFSESGPDVIEHLSLMTLGEAIHKCCQQSYSDLRQSALLLVYPDENQCKILSYILNGTIYEIVVYIYQ